MAALKINLLYRKRLRENYGISELTVDVIQAQHQKKL